ncbi:hypothetical protein BKA62DRAFT_626626, partial [Auriculariales sp. MPI-PUGE-AT-0066]
MAPPQRGYYGGPPGGAYAQDDAASYYGGSGGGGPYPQDDAASFAGSYYAPSQSSGGRPAPGGGPRSRAVDPSHHPPFTKEYVDQYRARIKADSDPETHFLYAKYLIDAAKKIGGNDSDQRAVRKYRDLLITEALKVIRRLATQGDAYSEAQFFLASCYGTGMLGLQVDHDKAYHLYLQAAKQNHPAACYRVAVCNEVGAGTKKDSQRAAMFYRKAASVGDVAAMYKLG